jgi:hypothetical protein
LNSSVSLVRVLKTLIPEVDLLMCVPTDVLGRNYLSVPFTCGARDDGYRMKPEKGKKKGRGIVAWFTCVFEGRELRRLRR